MVGKTAFEIIQAIKQYKTPQEILFEKTQPNKEELCESIYAIVLAGLSSAGIQDLNSLTDNGMLAVLFYLYGIGVIDPGFILDFANDPKREDVNLYKVKFTPSESEEHPFLLSVSYMRKSTEKAFNV